MGGKYDYGFVLNQEMVKRGETSHTKILQQVTPGSMVLECGPAYGIMTRYLKEILGCQVFIIEYDPDCYRHAIRYADGGLCTDLERDDWIDSFEDGFFDYIIYADVLEHLHDPLSVLTKMKRFLKSGGSVLLSVPNVAFGDIIMNLLCDRFTYTPLGLLDNTHIHLFAREDLKKMISDAGYYLAYESCIHFPLFASEQGAFIPLEERYDLEQALAKHPTRNIYQFVCRLVLTETETCSDVEADNDETPPTVSRFYLDLGDGYSEDTRVDVTAKEKNGRLCYSIELPKECKSVLFDPVKTRKCIVHDLVSTMDDVALPAIPLNGLLIGSDMLFCDVDPQIKLDTIKGGTLLCIEAGVTLLSENSWSLMEELVRKAQLEMGKLLTAKEEQLQAVNAAKADVEQALVVKEEQLQVVNAAKADVEQALVAKEEQLQAVNAAKAGALYIANQEIDTIRKKLELAEMQYHSILNSTTWRMTGPIRKILDVLKTVFNKR